MADIVLTGNTSGAITVAAPAVAGTNTLTLPANTGNIVTTGDSSTITQGMLASGVASTGPAFSAYNAGSQALSAGVATKVVFNGEDFDTNSNFDSTTNYRFTPTVAGYYQINVGIYYQASNNSFIMLYKNGININRLAGINSGLAMLSGSTLVNMNGTTDYLEMYAFNGSANTIGAGSSNLMFFDGHLARAA